MKKMKCSDMGGPCDAEIVAATPDEMMSKGYEHVKAAHPEMVADIEKMSPEEMAKWKEENIDKKFPDAPDMTEEEMEDERNIVLM